jgi:hypothetical protein
VRDKDAEIDLHRESDPASLPYSVDEHFHELMLDYFTPYHVIVGEGEGARALLDRLSAGRAGEGRQLIIYGDTGAGLPLCE